MSSAIKKVVNPLEAFKKNTKMLLKGDIEGAFKNTLDPGEIFAEPDTSANMSSDQTIEKLEENVIPETEQATIAESAALTAKKKKKETTQTILTSPLGSTQTAKTAVAKLGGY